MREEIDREIVRDLKEAGIDFACSIPCTLLAGVLEELPRSGIAHIPVTREEEGLGICAGAFLGGRKPCLIMQNSGLGNCINALASLHQLYNIPVLLIMGHRGGPGEPMVAQIPMGRVTPALLEVLKIPYERVEDRRGLAAVRRMAEQAFSTNLPAAVLLGRGVWV